MADRVLLGLAVVAAAAAAAPIVAGPFAEGTWIDPYKNRHARWAVYAGGAISLALFIALARRSG